MKKLRFVSDSKLIISYIVTGNNRINDFVPYISFDLDDYCSFNGEVPKYAMMISGLGHRGFKIIPGFDYSAYALNRISTFGLR